MREHADSRVDRKTACLRMAAREDEYYYFVTGSGLSGFSPSSTIAAFARS